MDCNLPTIGETQPYKYNGKEFDGMYGLNLFDYGARHYDAAIGRWMNMDPLTEGYYNISAYAYVGNNPVPIPNPGTVSIDNTHGAATGNPTQHTVQNPTTKSSNYTQTDKRYSSRTLSGASSMTKVTARGILVLDLAIYSLQLAGGWSVYDDMKKVKQNLGVLQGAVDMVNSAVANGMIPEQ